MEQYHRLLREILENGNVQFEPRTEEFILGISGWQSHYDLSEGFPLVTTKNVPPRLPFEELFWKLKGERSVKSLFDKNVHIWDANAFQHYLKREGLEENISKHTEKWVDEFEKWKKKLITGKENGDLGPVYGFQWRHWINKDGKEIDQLEKLIDGIREKPGSRYHILNAYNVGDLSEMALGPCPFWHQFTVYDDQLDLHMVQRSCDTFLGVPFNIAQDSLLLKMVAEETGLNARKFIHTTNNTHLYLGVPPRSNFWLESENVQEFQEKVKSVSERKEYKDVRNWYLSRTSEEDDINYGKDHIPDVLTQLAKRPRDLPKIGLNQTSIYDAIEKNVGNVVSVREYRPHRWKTNSIMAA
jgi:thymidylate synthase